MRETGRCPTSAFEKAFHSKDPRLWVQSDNTPKEFRNGLSGQLLCYLTQGGYFSQTGHYHLHVGHTHEDVDAVMSLVTIGMREEACLETPADVMRCLRKKIGPVFARKQMDFEVELVETAPRPHQKRCD